MQMEPLTVIDKLAEDRDLVFRFFAAFSRFEYALKRSGFLKRRPRAEADWDAYANGIRGQFAAVQDSTFKGACTCLTKEPPRTQVVGADDQLVWRATEQGQGESLERFILRLVGTVRNNLFHGGKYPDPTGPVADVARNRRLLEAGITVLRQCLELSPSVQSQFVEAA